MNGKRSKRNLRKLKTFIGENRIQFLKNETHAILYSQLTHAGAYLQPLVDSIANHLHAVAMIHIITPIPERGGDIEVRSVHANWPGGIKGSSWPTADPVTYAEAEKAMISFGNRSFRKYNECETERINDLPSL